jgi:hypothetical protein
MRWECIKPCAVGLRQLSGGDLTQVIFNNNYEDQGQPNGREMIALLAENP